MIHRGRGEETATAEGDAIFEANKQTTFTGPRRMLRISQSIAPDFVDYGWRIARRTAAAGAAVSQEEAANHAKGTEDEYYYVPKHAKKTIDLSYILYFFR